MNMYNIYFSPTGGTRKVSEAVVQGWGEEFSPVDLMKLSDEMSFQPEDICLIAVPSYGGRVPGAAVDRLKLLHGNGAGAVLIAVFGNRAIDDTLLELSDVLEQAGFRPAAAMEAVARHSLLPQYGAGRPDAEDCRELADFAQKVRRSMDEGKADGELSLPGNRPYVKYEGVPLKPSAGKGCVGCGLCADECPVGAIPIDNCRITDSKKCISCMHCVQICPEHARKVNGLVAKAAGMAMKKYCSGRKPNRLYL